MRASAACIAIRGQFCVDQARAHAVLSTCLALVPGADGECGDHATTAMARMIEGRHVVCEERDIDHYGRVVAVCQVDGADANAALMHKPGKWKIKTGAQGQPIFIPC